MWISSGCSCVADAIGAEEFNGVTHVLEGVRNFVCEA
jgi:hypothetical protein